MLNSAYIFIGGKNGCTIQPRCITAEPETEPVLPLKMWAGTTNGSNLVELWYFAMARALCKEMGNCHLTNKLQRHKRKN